MLISSLFAFLFISSNRSDGILEKYFEELPTTMTFVAGSPSGEHPINFHYNLGEFSGSKDYGENSQIFLERYRLEEGSKVTIGGKNIHLICAVVFASREIYEKEESFALEYVFLADEKSCTDEEVSMKSATSVSLSFHSKSPGLLSGAQVQYHRTPFWAEKVTPTKSIK